VGICFDERKNRFAANKLDNFPRATDGFIRLDSQKSNEFEINKKTLPKMIWQRFFVFGTIT
jgi:hypothetical protein